MRKCPFCGAVLADELVAAVLDPNADESCPRLKVERLSALGSSW